jgi:hypothetical protein
MSTVTRICPRCGEWYTGEHYWKVCLTCFKRERDAERHAEAYRDGYKAGVAASTPLDDETLMAIIRLTHPDRHPAERRDEATRVTAMLLAMRS